MTTIAFLESNTSGTGARLLQAAIDRGLEVVFVARDVGRYGFLAEQLVHPILVETNDEQATVNRLRQVPDLVGVLSSSEYYVATAARAAAALGLFGADPEAIERCRNKASLAHSLRRAGIRTPATYRFHDLEEALAIMASVDHPVVVKPIDESGSTGVRLHRDASEFEAHVGALLQRRGNARGQAVVSGGLIQSYVLGEEYSVETIGLGDRIHVLGVTKKYLGDPPTFVEVGHDFPAAISAEIETALTNCALKALRAVGLVRGPAHIEMRLSDDGPVIIEVNPRLAGGMIPSLMDLTLHTDVLGLLIDLYAGRSPVLPGAPDGTASIGFVVAPNDGVLADVTAPGGGNRTVRVQRTAELGARIRRRGDFTDRVGYALAHGSSAEESRGLVSEAIDACEVDIRASASPLQAIQKDTGRISTTLHPTAQRIVRVPGSIGSRRRGFANLAAVDEAHVLMLVEQGVLEATTGRSYLRAVRTLADEGFERLLEEAEPRGAYLLYESALTAILGDEGGSAHLGRSRNDINAATFLLDLRLAIVDVARSIWRLRSAIVQQAGCSRDIEMPVYSQYQPGSPGTFSFYLLGVERALARDCHALLGLLDDVGASPLGACSGSGTTVPIDPSRVARLLGFNAVMTSALDAIASRDCGLRAVATTAMAGTHVSRMAQDYQIWTTQEFAFLDLPDDLVGGSSNMPQKRNPYLLEVVKARSIRPSGHWSNMIAMTQKVPYCNSVEVGTEAVAEQPLAMRSLCDAADLMALIVAGARPNQAAMARAATHGVVEAIGVAEALARGSGVSFRVAHHQVGAAVRRSLAGDQRPDLSEMIPTRGSADGLAGAASMFDFGGGPGPTTTKRNLDLAHDELTRDANVVRSFEARWLAADKERRSDVEDLLGRTRNGRS